MSINRVFAEGETFLHSKFCKTQWCYIQEVWLIYSEAFSVTHFGPKRAKNLQFEPKMIHSYKLTPVPFFPVSLTKFNVELQVYFSAAEQKAAVSKGTRSTQKAGEKWRAKGTNLQGFPSSPMPNKIVKRTKSEWQGWGHSEAQ